MIEEEIFKDAFYDKQKLLEYGFQEKKMAFIMNLFFIEMNLR